MTICAVIKEFHDDVDVAVLVGAMQRRAELDVLFVDTSASLDEQAHSLEVAVLRCVVERRLVPTIDDIDVGAGLDQQPDERRLAGPRRLMQRRAVVAARPNVRVRAALRQQPTNVELRLHDGVVQARHAVQRMQ